MAGFTDQLGRRTPWFWCIRSLAITALAVLVFFLGGQIQRAAGMPQWALYLCGGILIAFGVIAVDGWLATKGS